MDASARRLYEQLHGDDAGNLAWNCPIALMRWPAAGEFGISDTARNLYLMAYNVAGPQWRDGKQLVTCTVAGLALWFGVDEASIRRAFKRLAKIGLAERVDAKLGVYGHVVYRLFDVRQVAERQFSATIAARMELPIALVDDAPLVLKYLDVADDEGLLPGFDDESGGSAGSSAGNPGAAAEQSGGSAGATAGFAVTADDDQQNFQTQRSQELAAADRVAAADSRQQRRADCNNVKREEQYFNVSALEGEQWWRDNHPERVARWGEPGRYRERNAERAKIENHWLRGASEKSLGTCALQLATNLRALEDKADKHAQESICLWAVMAVRDGALPWAAIDECLNHAKCGSPKNFGAIFTGALRKKFFDVARPWPAKGGDAE